MGKMTVGQATSLGMQIQGLLSKAPRSVRDSVESYLKERREQEDAAKQSKQPQDTLGI